MEIRKLEKTLLGTAFGSFLAGVVVCTLITEVPSLELKYKNNKNVYVVPAVISLSITACSLLGYQSILSERERVERESRKK